MKPRPRRMTHKEKAAARARAERAHPVHLRETSEDTVTFHLDTGPVRVRLVLLNDRSVLEVRSDHGSLVLRPAISNVVFISSTIEVPS